MSLATARERRSQNRAETRRAILDATEALLLAVGQAGFSIRKLVARCGYSAPTIYHHFKDKDGLIDALLEERLMRLTKNIKRVVLVDDPVENLRALTRAFAHFGFQNPTHYQLLTQVPREEDRTIESAEEARRLMEIPVEQLAQRSWIELGDRDALRQAIWTMVHGIVAMHTLRPDIEWNPKLLDLSIEGIVRGWLSPAAARRTGPPEGHQE
jgi:AcrR family transcriptional regulator